MFSSSDLASDTLWVLDRAEVNASMGDLFANILSLILIVTFSHRNIPIAWSNISTDSCLADEMAGEHETQSVTG
jgi:hypothetical protein